ncbi:hypothetical protein LPMP_312050 [Leishmania panamensis]|uniref:Uncharacterized protein n=2 Tax=Leishmania guyanensis species complex TaxID=38579 RepID=A0A088RXB7_LEIPA|nr:hypothetical protein LPMP_312050 [Leishmania panamensis]AIO00793.1 hypothetical protein LPMP_312050 [Leishmania panamensis]
MGLTCAREQEAVSPSTGLHSSLDRRRSHVRSTQPPFTSGKSACRHTLATRSRADVYVGLDNSCEALCAVECVDLPAPHLTRLPPPPSCAETRPPKLNRCHDETAQATALVGTTPSAPRYPLYHIPDSEDDDGYTVVPFKSTYCLQRATDVEPDNFRAMVTHSHATATEQSDTATATYDPKGDDGTGGKDATSPTTVSRTELVKATRILPKQSLGELRGGLSSDVISDSTDDRVSRQADGIHCTSIFELELILQPESLSDSASYECTPSIFSMTKSTETDKYSSTAFASQRSLSRRHTFGILMPTGHSQVVEHTEDGGAWEPQFLSSGVSADERQSCRKQSSAMVVANIGDKGEQSSAFGVRGHRRHHDGRRFDRHRHRVRGETAVLPRDSTRSRSKVGRPWPQPIMEGPKSNLSRSRSFNVEETLGCSALSARFVPSPDWQRVDMIEEEQRRLAQVLKVHQNRLAKWQRMQVAHWKTVSS